MPTPDKISVVCLSVSLIDGGRECPQRGFNRRESHMGLCPLDCPKASTKWNQRRDRRGKQYMSQGEENSLLWSYPVSAYNVIFSLRQCSDSLTSRQGWKRCKLDWGRKHSEPAVGFWVLCSGFCWLPFGAQTAPVPSCWAWTQSLANLFQAHSYLPPLPLLLNPSDTFPLLSRSMTCSQGTEVTWAIEVKRKFLPRIPKCPGNRKLRKYLWGSSLVPGSLCSHPPQGMTLLIKSCQRKIHSYPSALHSSIC